MAFALGPAAAAAGHRLASFETIGSTNAEGMERARGGECGPIWIAARHQSAGRGRRGRTWETAPGNLAASLLLTVEAEPAMTATLGFVAGLALDVALSAAAPGAGFATVVDAGGDAGPKAERFRLKWPNDLLLDGRKVAGILLEAVLVHPARQAVVIGFGVNVAAVPDDLPYPATSLAACGAGVSAEALFERLSDAWVAEEAVWDSGRGFAALRERWLGRAAGLGTVVAVRNGGAVHRGIFETIDEQGRLVVRAADGSRSLVSAGDVHFSAAATVH